MSDVIETARELLKTSAMLDGIVTVEAIRLATGLPIVDTNHLVAFSGEPEGATVWLIFETEQERQQAWLRRAAVGDQMRGVLLDRGYPAEAARSVRVSLASLTQIENAGGPAKFYR